MISYGSDMYGRTVYYYTRLVWIATYNARARTHYIIVTSRITIRTLAAIRRNNMYRVCGFETRTTDRITHYRYTRAWFTARGIGNRLYNDTGTDHQKSINSIRRYLFAEGASAVIMIILCLRNARIGLDFCSRAYRFVFTCIRGYVGMYSCCKAVPEILSRSIFGKKQKNQSYSRSPKKARFEIIALSRIPLAVTLDRPIAYYCVCIGIMPVHCCPRDL